MCCAPTMSNKSLTYIDRNIPLSSHCWCYAIEIHAKRHAVFVHIMKMNVNLFYIINSRKIQTNIYMCVYANLFLVFDGI